MFTVVVLEKKEKEIRGIYTFRSKDDAEDFEIRLPENYEALIREAVQEPGAMHLSALRNRAESDQYLREERHKLLAPNVSNKGTANTEQKPIGKWDLFVVLMLVFFIVPSICGLMYFAVSFGFLSTIIGGIGQTLDSSRPTQIIPYLVCGASAMLFVGCCVSFVPIYRYLRKTF